MNDEVIGSVETEMGGRASLTAERIRRMQKGREVPQDYSMAEQTGWPLWRKVAYRIAPWPRGSVITDLNQWAAEFGWQAMQSVPDPEPQPEGYDRQAFLESHAVGFATDLMQWVSDVMFAEMRNELIRMQAMTHNAPTGGPVERH